jgi:hypothetical protein
MNAGVQNLVLSLGLMQGESTVWFLIFLKLTCLIAARKVPFEDPQVLLYVRVGYVAAQVLILGVYYYISLLVRVLIDDAMPESGR